MERIGVRPRGLVTRAAIAAATFVAAVVPGWALGDAVERWSGWGVLDWLVTCVVSGAAVFLMAPSCSYRRRDALLGMVPLYGWYLTAVLSWRVGLLPLRDWEPRTDELRRARWLTGELVGYWRAGTFRSGSGPRAGRPTS